MKSIYERKINDNDRKIALSIIASVINFAMNWYKISYSEVSKFFSDNGIWDSFNDIPLTIWIGHDGENDFVISIFEGSCDEQMFDSSISVLCNPIQYKIDKLDCNVLRLLLKRNMKIKTVEEAANIWYMSKSREYIISNQLLKIPKNVAYQHLQYEITGNEEWFAIDTSDYKIDNE